MYDQQKQEAQMQRMAQALETIAAAVTTAQAEFGTACGRIAVAIEAIAASQERIAAAWVKSQTAKAADVKVEFTKPPLPPRVKAQADDQPSGDKPATTGKPSEGQRALDEVQSLALVRIGRYGDQEPATDKQYGLWCGKTRAILGSDEARHAVTALLANIETEVLDTDPQWRPSKSECSAWLDWLMEKDSQSHEMKPESVAGLKAIWRLAQEQQGQLPLFDEDNPFEDLE